MPERTEIEAFCEKVRNGDFRRYREIFLNYITKSVIIFDDILRLNSDKNG